jgi:hypothetical protein
VDVGTDVQTDTSAKDVELLLTLRGECRVMSMIAILVRYECDPTF